LIAFEIYIFFLVFLFVTFISYIENDDVFYQLPFCQSHTVDEAITFIFTHLSKNLLFKYISN